METHKNPEQHQPSPIDHSHSQGDDGCHEHRKYGKRTRSVALRMMLDELASIKKESREATDEIEATLAKPDPVPENVVARHKSGVDGKKRISGGDVGAGSSKKRKHKEVIPSRFCDIQSHHKGKKKAQETGDVLKVKKEPGVTAEEQHESLKGKTTISSGAHVVQGDDREYITLSFDSERVYSPITVDRDEEWWSREVKDLFPVKVVNSCLRRRISNIVLYECDNDEQYFSDIKKRRKQKEKILCGAWFDYARDAKLKEGDIVHFIIRYPPDEEILVYVDRKEVQGGGR